MAGNTTRRQHFVSQAEQRLNAINPDARPSNQRIHALKIGDRDRHQLILDGQNGKLIANTLSMFDLFSFDVANDGTRQNFETAFGVYEGRIRPLTERLLQAHGEQSNAVGQELFDLFVAKMVNFIRNPYSVAKMLNTFGIMGQHHPAHPEVRASYVRILEGRRPQQRHLCQVLGISDEQYGAWLRVMFMLIMPLADGFANMLEQSMSGLFEGRDHDLCIHLHRFSTERCLLSDRGVSSPIAQDPHLVFDFNLSAHAFIRYAFVDYAAVLGRPVPLGILAGLGRGPKMVNISYLVDDLPALEGFHRRMVEQAFERVYCSGPAPYGVSVVGPRDIAVPG